ncbi:putative retrotransposon gag domain, gag-polypeptide of LTR copia-type [Lupinus albus]|uniref:Putative retrotransposon gag domain, gag-polypeptide of LTR copia-type n=1 Tax=Lupinus albus TaxID=3870 RepID=A0A6A4NNX7_LUPAL|nr:putative retrotransposon gag domain, gag-polypeptide of LTR copia-type [Lupinus albus]
MANQSIITDYHNNPSNPYFLHSNENPALILVTPPLNGKNDHSWARAMKLTLQSKNKLQFIDGSASQPPLDDPSHGAWLRCNTMVLSWIQHSIEEGIVKSVLWIDLAADVWKDLRERFSQGDIFRIVELQEEFYHLNQGKLIISDYFTQLKTLWEEIENFRPIKICKCSIPCSCGAVESLRAYRDQDYVIRFLKGLNDQFAQVRSQIMLIDPLLGIAKVFSMLVQQERQFNNSITSTLDLEPKILSINSQQNPQFRNNSGVNTYSRSRA